MKDLRCLVGLHKWWRSKYETGAPSLKCRRCGKEIPGDASALYTKPS